MSFEISPSLHNKRELSDFFSQELIYDYVQQKLDPTRSEAMKRKVETSLALNRKISELGHGLSYCHHLGEAQVAENYLQKLRKPSSYLADIKRRLTFSDWHPGVRAVINGVLFGLAFVLLLILPPWRAWLPDSNPSPRRNLVLTELKKDPKPTPNISALQEPTYIVATQYELQMKNLTDSLSKIQHLLEIHGAKPTQAQGQWSEPLTKKSIRTSFTLPETSWTKLSASLQAFGVLTLLNASPNKQNQSILNVELMLKEVGSEEDDNTTSSEN